MTAGPVAAPRWPIEACKAEECGAPLVWAYMWDGGRAHPVDAAPSAKGNLRLVEGRGRRPVAEVLKGDDLAVARASDEPLHKSHFATCTKAATFRKPKR